jgi:hypothetical protein
MKDEEESEGSEELSRPAVYRSKARFTLHAARLPMGVVGAMEIWLVA